LGQFGQLGLYPTDPIEFGFQSLLGNLYDGRPLVCADTPAGTYDTSFFVLDGKGGRSGEYPLRVIVLENPVSGGAIDYTME